ncbi:STAS domain-containing protein [Micromonospora sp. NPDC126480]|uniref:STAS domain-containing protein n=1 Tax=Micromonospora sp. NPDC126480 TaxID=3155312 RepID=UPI003333DC64
MAAQLLTIEVSRLDAGRARLRLTGELDYDTAPDLVAAAAQLRREGHRDLLVDLDGVEICDSSGLSALVVMHRDGTGVVRLCGVRPHLRGLLDRTGLLELLTVEHAADERPEDGLREVG